MFNEIIELEAIHKQKIEISKRELELSTPKLNNLELIPIIYDWFCEFHGTTQRTTSDWNCNAVQFRKQFIFIILYLYSPQKLAGGKIVAGLRKVLINVVNLSTKTIISNNSYELMVDYNTFKDFRTSVDQAYILIQERLRDMGIYV